MVTNTCKNNSFMQLVKRLAQQWPNLFSFGWDFDVHINVFPSIFQCVPQDVPHSSTLLYRMLCQNLNFHIYINHKGGPNSMLLCWGVPNVLGKKRGYGPIKVAPSKTKTKLWIQPPTN